MEGGLPESAMAVVSVSAVENRACCLLTAVWWDERGVGVNPDAEERSNIEVVSERRIVLEINCFSIDVAVGLLFALWARVYCVFAVVENWKAGARDVICGKIHLNFHAAGKRSL
jgi:hypothetical protein